jgi:replicative DNA helicase
MTNNISSFDKLPPQAIEAEQSLLGCLMLDKNAIVKIADFLTPQDFYRGIHSEIYSACQELFEKGEPIDILSCSNRLKEKGKLEEIGGNSYLAELVNSVPTASHILNYAKIIQRKSILRSLINASYEIGQFGYDENEDPNLLLDKAEQKIFSIAQKNLSQRFLSIKESLEEAFERIDKLSKQGRQLRGLATGFTALDNILSGLQKSDLIILAARPSIGKSGLALNIASYVAIQKKVPVGIFSLEMSKDQVVDRLIAEQANIDLWRLRTGKLSKKGEDNDFIRINQAMGILSEAPIYIDDSSSTNSLHIKALARRLQAKEGLGLIIVDYLQLMESKNSQNNMVQQMTEISRSLKSLAKDLNIPVLAVSQLSRAVEQRVPQIPRLSDLRESGSLEQDADVVLFIYREDRYRQDTIKKNIADIIIAKHRNGPVGKIELYFDESRATFRNLEKSYSETELSE